MADSGCCVLTMPLCTEQWQENIIEKRFAIIEHLKNQLIAKELRKLKNLQRTKAFRRLEEEISKTPYEQRKALYRQRTKMLRDAGFSEYAFKDDMQSSNSPMQKHFVEHIAVQIAHKAASDVWRAFEKCIFNNGRMIHFHKRGTLDSVACQKAGNGMSYKDGVFVWSGGNCPNKIKLEIRVMAPRNEYERMMLEKPVKNLRIVRKWMKNRYKYYLQFTLNGLPVPKDRPLGEGRVGIDIGPRTAAIVSNHSAALLELADQIDDNYAKERVIKQKMDRSKRFSNPDNYNPDGTIKKKPRGSYHWMYSERYLQLAGQVRELERKNADIRKYQHTCLANWVLSEGNEIYVESMSFSGLQHRAKETKVDSSGRFMKKKRFGKSLANKAPATFLSILKTKAEQSGARFYEVNTREFKASQYDHTAGNYTPTKLSERWKNLSNGDVVQRDLYSAFLLMNSNSNLTKSDRDLCFGAYSTFLQHHEREINRIKSSPLRHPSSFGI